MRLADYMSIDADSLKVRGAPCSKSGRKLSKADAQSRLLATLSTLNRSVSGLSAPSATSRALLQTWGTAAPSHPVGGLGSICERILLHHHGFVLGRGYHPQS